MQKIVSSVILLGLLLAGLTAGALQAADDFQATPKTIQFAGRTWYVKASPQEDPGGNAWSDDSQSVWVDENGKLHLKIRNIDGVWHCAEIYSVEPAAYGTYRFYVETPLNDLDINAVLGLFLYQDLMHEIDIEVARWGRPDGPNAQYAVQPYDQVGHREQFFMPWNQETMYELTWQEDSILFRTLAGNNLTAGIVIHEWTYSLDGVPQTNPAMLLRMNLWLFGVSSTPAPANNQDIEVVISSLDAPPPLIIDEGIPTPSVDCENINLETTINTLVIAQGNLAGGNRETALDQLAEAAATLQNIVSICGDGPTPTPPPSETPPPSPTSTTPQVTITEAEAYFVQGTVSPTEYCNPNYKLALYAYKPDQWWVQPWADAPNIEINADDCTWQTETHDWDRLAVHLVPSGYEIRSNLFGLACSPLRDDPAVLAIDCYPD